MTAAHRAPAAAEEVFQRDPPDIISDEDDRVFWRSMWTSLIASMEKRTAEGEAAGET